MTSGLLTQDGGVERELALPDGIRSEPLSERSLLLTGSGSDPFRDSSWGPVKIPGLSRYLAFSLTSHFVTSPFFGTDLDAVPPRCQVLLWEGEGGTFGAMLPVLDGDFRTEAVGRDGGIALTCSCGPSGRASRQVALAVVALAADPYRAVGDAVSSAVAWMGRGRLRADKKTPRWMDLFGWCTWDAFYTDVDEEKILAGLEAFRGGGLVPGHLIIDEGWQDCTPDKYLLSLGLKPGAFSGERLTSLITRAKKEFGVRMVGCWRTLFGQLRGVDVDSPGLSAYRRRLVHEKGTEKDTFGVVEPEDVRRFHDDYAARMAADGVDFVKVDFQSALHLMTYEQIGRSEGARLWQSALQNSVEKHFQGEMLNCMALGSDEVFHTRSSNVARSSDDFFPTKDESHPAHIRQNLYNALWLSHFEWPDWDMFQSRHPWAWYHAVGRAISGGPVYVSDKPGESDCSLLARFLAADGKLLRCPQPALPTRDTIFENPFAEKRLIKAFNRCGDAGVLAVFHPDPDGSCITGEAGAWQVEGMGAEDCAVYSLNGGFLGVHGAQSALPVSLECREADLLVFSPVASGFAPIGLIDKMLPPAGILSLETCEGGVELLVRGGGRFGFFLRGGLRGVTVDAAPVGVESSGEFHAFETGDLPCIQARILFGTAS